MYAQLNRFFDRRGLRDDPSFWCSDSNEAMVVTAHYLATAAGIEIVKQGGNAIDAAVAASLALSVCESAGSGLGGMGMMLVYHANTNRSFTIEGACRAPVSATPDQINEQRRYRGYGAVAVPGLISALAHALGRYGNLDPCTVLQPAIKLARDGFPLTHMQNNLINHYKKSLKTDYVRQMFLNEQGTAKAPGTIFKQTALAATLEKLSVNGLEDFYRGEIADRIIADMQANNGFISKADLEHCMMPRESRPLRTGFDDGIVLSMGPPAGGLSLIQLLKSANRLDREILCMDDPAGVVRIARMIRQVRKDRRKYRLKIGYEEPGKANRWLEDKKIEAVIRAVLKNQDSSGETSHLCTADGEGNWVSMTQSIERSFGAGVATPTLGFLYNGYLRAFKIKNKRHPHYLRPGIPARSNAAPTLVIRNGKPVLAIGSTGSERMQSGIFEVLLRLRQETPFAAVHAPRLHCSPEGEVLIEADRFPKDFINALQADGFTIKATEPYAFNMGGLQLLVRDGKTFTGVSEPRRDGMALGI